MQSHYNLKTCAVEEKKEAGASLPFDIGICLAIVWVLSECRTLLGPAPHFLFYRRRLCQRTGDNKAAVGRVIIP